MAYLEGYYYSFTELFTEDLREFSWMILAGSQIIILILLVNHA